MIAEAAEAAEAAETLIVGPGEVLHLETPDDGARLEAAIGGGPLASVGDRIEAPTSGDHWLAVASRDRSGNLSPIRWIRLRVDNTPPRVALTTDPAPFDDRWLPPGSTAQVTVADDLAGNDQLFLAVNDEIHEVATEDALSAMLPDNGDVVLRAWAIDDAGNRSAETRLELSVDAVPATAEIRVDGPRVQGADGGEILAPTSKLSVHPSDADSGPATWSVQIDGSNAPSSALVEPWSPGSHTVAPSLVDAVGNTTTLPDWHFIVDAEGPEIQWRIKNGGREGGDGATYYAPPIGLEVTASDALAGVAQLAGSPDGADPRPIEGTVITLGESYILTSRDRVGNTSRVEASWRLDTSPPEIWLEAGDERFAAGDNVTITSGTALQVRASDAGAGIAFALFRVKAPPGYFWTRWWWDDYPRPVPGEITLQRRGEVTLVVEASDWLGNSTEISWPVTVEGGGS